MKEVVCYGVDQDYSSVQGTYTTTVNANVRITNGWINNTSGANGDEFFFTRYFPKSGTYKIRLYVTTFTDEAKLDVGLDSNGANNIFSQIDCYAVSQGTITKDTILNISRGYHSIHFKANGHNASSSSYVMRLNFIQFDLIAEYPTPQEDNAANGSLTQGMVPLGVHEAQLAESSFQFNLADIGVDKYEEIMVLINGSMTASLELQAIINGVNSGIGQQGWTSIGATLANVSLSSRTSIQIASTSIISGSASLEGKLTIHKSSNSKTWLGGNTEASSFGVNTEYTRHGSGSLGNSITSIKIQTGTSTWAVGTVISVWGVKKK